MTSPARTRTDATPIAGGGDANGSTSFRRALSDVARMHYDHGMTHREIAETIGTSRVRVTRMIAEARRTGIVEITVHGDSAPFPEEGAALAARFGLERAVVAPSLPEHARTRRSVALVAAELIAESLDRSELAAFGLSSTVGAAVAELPNFRADQLVLIPAAGGWAGPATGLNPDEVTSRIAALTGASSYNLLAPLLGPTAEVATRIRDESLVRAGLDRAARADTLITGIGGMTWEESALQAAVSVDERAALAARGAVGDTSGRFFDADGRPVMSPLDARVIGLTLEQMVRIPNRVVVAY
ncbi:MAG: sugar-binding transcriptional regulator, partial [Actinomycetaceae bacterium]